MLLNLFYTSLCTALLKASHNSESWGRFWSLKHALLFVDGFGDCFGGSTLNDGE